MRLKDLLELIRLPNLFTAPTNVAMGLAVSGLKPGMEFVLLGTVSALAYAGGMALNDACDAGLDKVERPKRPIPSGRVTQRDAFTAAGVFLATSLALSAYAGWKCFSVALALVTMIVVYDALAKPTRFGPAAMASCRALNAGLGIAAGTASRAGLVAAAILFFYVLLLTLISRFEVKEAPVVLLRAGAVGYAAILLAAFALIFFKWREGTGAGTAFLALLAFWLYFPLRAAIAEPLPGRIIGFVKAAVLGMIGLDAAFVAASQGFIPGLAVALFFVPALILGRRFASA